MSEQSPTDAREEPAAQRSAPPAAPGVLAPYRVLDLTTSWGYLCGKILGDLGADVVKVEPPGGDPDRGLGPFYQGEPAGERSLFWFAYNTSKRGITLALDCPTGRELFLRLVRRADFVLESFPPGHLASLGLDFATLRAVNPRVILTSITPFGTTGPYAGYQGTDLEAMALGGFMAVTGQPGRPPVRVSAVPQAPMWASMHAAMGTLIAHWARERTGRGQHVDTSAQASVIHSLAHAPTFWDVARTNPERGGEFMTGRSITGARMRAIWPCKDGYINFIIYGGPAGIRTLQALVAWMEEKGVATERLKQWDWSQFNVATITQEEVDAIEEPAGRLFRMLTKAEYYQGVVERGMLGYPVATAADHLADPQLAARGFWRDLEHPELGTTLRYPGPFARFGRGSCELRRRAPRLGEHNREIYCDELGLSLDDLAALKGAGVI
ncbi:MAG TPA: CoA transferase [Chloroflexota bacterium]|nr:CoA transferase [Chloroflexota bacterium]